MTTSNKVRLQFEISRELDQEIEEIAKLENVTKSEILRRSLSVMKAFRQQAKRGRQHLGFVEDPTKLDAEMLGILTSRLLTDSTREPSDRDP
jgi:hypothetical protein